MGFWVEKDIRCIDEVLIYLGWKVNTNAYIRKYVTGSCMTKSLSIYVNIVMAILMKKTYVTCSSNDDHDSSDER